MAFLQIFDHNNYCFFLFSKHLDTMSNVTDCGYGQTDLCLKSEKSRICRAVKEEGKKSKNVDLILSFEAIVISNK